MSGDQQAKKAKKKKQKQELQQEHTAISLCIKNRIMQYRIDMSMHVRGLPSGY